MQHAPRHLAISPIDCVGCHLCEKACAIYHSSDKTEESALKEGEIPRLIIQDGTPPIPLICFHCEDAPCERVCPSGAIQKDGRRIIQDREKCIGCRLCLHACPFGAARLFAGKALKCDLCDGTPACVEICPTGTLRYESLYHRRIPRSSLIDVISLLKEPASSIVDSVKVPDEEIGAAVRFLKALPKSSDELVPIVEIRRKRISKLIRQTKGAEKLEVQISPPPQIRRGKNLDDFVLSLKKEGLAATWTRNVLRKRKELDLPEIEELEKEEIQGILKSASEEV